MERSGDSEEMETFQEKDSGQAKATVERHFRRMGYFKSSVTMG